MIGEYVYHPTGISEDDLELLRSINDDYKCSGPRVEGQEFYQV
jgi:hypothetical protein